MISKETDVLVIGGGNAGLCAAITAREAGARVMLVEHADRNMRGGNSRHTRNLRAMHQGPLATLSGSYSEEEYWQDIVRVTRGKTDEALARLTIRNSGSLVTWLENHGVHFQPALSGTLNLSRTNAFFLGGGKALVNALYLAAERLGVVIEYSAEAQSLVIENGRFQSALIHGSDDELEMKAQALVTASGGFQANTAWLREVWGERADNFIIRGTPYAQGRMLKELLRHGMKSVGSADQCHAVAIDARAPKFDGGIVSRLDSVPFGIVVNKNAERFYDEGEDFWPRRYAIWGNLIRTIWMTVILRNCSRLNLIGRELLIHRRSMPIPCVPESLLPISGWQWMLRQGSLGPTGWLARTSLRPEKLWQEIS